MYAPRPVDAFLRFARVLRCRAMRLLTAICAFCTCASSLALAQDPSDRAAGGRALGGLFGERRPATPADPDLARLRSEIASLAGHADAQAAAGAIADARAAIARLQAARARNDEASALRAKAFAWAALTLGARQI